MIRFSAIARRAGRGAVWVIILLSALLTFGVSGHDQAAFGIFTEDVNRWQTDPEFRRIALEYCAAGSNAAGTRPFGIPARRTIITLRSAPGLPRRLAVNPTSRLHYENFSKGPLSAYLHLCSEQDVPQVLGVVESAGRSSRAPDDLRQVLGSFKMDYPVAEDAGAMQSVGDLIRDVDAERPFVVRNNVGPLLTDAIAQVAGELQLPPRVEEMSPLQQQFVLDRLDGFVHTHDPELWRTKQVNDFCGGVWAQVFGPPYNRLIVPFLRIRRGAQVLLVVLLALLARRKRRPDLSASEQVQREGRPSTLRAGAL